MSVQTVDHEPSLFDPKPHAEPAEHAPPVVPAEATEAAPPAKQAEPGAAKSKAKAKAKAVEPVEASAGVEQVEDTAGVDADAEKLDQDEDTERNDRKRLEEQLSALRRKEAELLRALAITDHPDLADAIRTIEARVYCVTRADAKLAQGLSKSEARRQEVLTKKLSALREKRAELDTQITVLEAESQELGASRVTDFQRERQDALQSLMIALAQHDAAIGAAGLDVRALLPEIGTLLPELEAIARSVSEVTAN